MARRRVEEEQGESGPQAVLSSMWELTPQGLSHEIIRNITHRNLLLLPMCS